MHTSDNKLNSSLKRQLVKTLAQVIADTKSFEESEQFLQDFLTKSELESLAKRLAVAYWLKKGRSYSNIKRNLKVSSATIASVSSALHTDGFTRAVEMADADKWAESVSGKLRKLFYKRKVI